ncbi:glycosyltransferase [Conexibacter sp. DBS9H8]|uniref:glycosyltransferase n=1 Tax=Conexibacter sp. DBS9H8 TaxID=2937801 RepID=UPI00200C7FEE|nr:glycosyltransferase [Conexibacter sp. DBS9H8]
MTEILGWASVLGDRGGYGNAARNFVRGLRDAGSPPALAQIGPTDPDIGERDQQLLRDLAHGDLAGVDTMVAHVPPPMLVDLVPRLRAVAGTPVAACTIAETDRLSAEWAAACNLADEVWVPTTFNLLTFAASGVDPHKLRLVPYGIDGEAWEPLGLVNRSVAPDDHFVFLYTFQFDWRKGFDLLLASYLQEFTRADPVTLVLKIFEPPGAVRSIRARLAESILDRVDLLSEDLPRVVIIDEALEREALAALHRRADLYISTDRANGWGMPCMEQMAMGKAAACIDWSGSTEFMHADNALLIPARVPLVPVDARLQRERPDYRGQRWAEASEADVRAVMRSAFAGEVDLARLGAAARAEILERWSLADSARWIAGRDAGAYTPAPGLASRLRPMVGLSEHGVYANPHPRMLACDAAHLSDADLAGTLSAYAAAFPADTPVALVLAGDPARITGRVMAAFQAIGVDPDDIADAVVGAEIGDVLADPRLVGLIGAGRWPDGLTTACAADPEALRAALDRSAPPVFASLP